MSTIALAIREEERALLALRIAVTIGAPDVELRRAVWDRARVSRALLELEAQATAERSGRAA